jgi:hypothetical protein
MASLPQQNPYQCDQCGTPDIVAMPLLYQQGTRTYSTTVGWGSSQTNSAQASIPPRTRGYVRPLLLWSVPIVLFFLWSYAGFSAVLERPNIMTTAAEEAALFLVLGLTCLAGLVSNLGRISRYNRDVYPRLHWDWEHTYKCRRCGSLRLIGS